MNAILISVVLGLVVLLCTFVFYVTYYAYDNGMHWGSKKRRKALIIISRVCFVFLFFAFFPILRILENAYNSTNPGVLALITVYALAFAMLFFLSRRGDLVRKLIQPRIMKEYVRRKAKVVMENREVGCYKCVLIKPKSGKETDFIVYLDSNEKYPKGKILDVEITSSRPYGLSLVKVIKEGEA